MEGLSFPEITKPTVNEFSCYGRITPSKINPKFRIIHAILSLFLILSVIALFFITVSLIGWLIKSSSNFEIPIEDSNIISNNRIDEFGSSISSISYKCTGYCSCEIRNNVIASRSFVSFFVTAFTTYLAYRKANEYFMQECEKSISCPPKSTVQSEIQSCERNEDEELEQGDLEFRESDFSSKEKNTDVRRFFCKGNCMINGGLKTFQSITAAENFGCEKLSRGREVEIDVYEIRSKPSHYNMRAGEYFTKKYLTSFCRDRSKERYLRTSASGRSYWITYSRCVGTKFSKKNMSIHCIQIHPVPPSGRTNAKKYWSDE